MFGKQHPGRTAKRGLIDEQALWHKLWTWSPHLHRLVSDMGLIPALCHLGIVRPSPEIRPDLKNWLVKLATGEERCVQAINVHHAKSLVVYGARLRVDARTGKPVGPTLVHPSNIISVRLSPIAAEE